MTVKPINKILGKQELSKLVRALPKAELHCHLEGAIWPAYLLELAEEYPIPLPSKEINELSKAIQVGQEDKSLIDFLKKFEPLSKVFISLEVIAKITRQVVREASDDGVCHLELRFQPSFMSEAYSLNPRQVVQTVLSAGNAAAAECGLSIAFIIIAGRDRGAAEGQAVLTLAQEFKELGVVAIDLAGDEYNYPPVQFKKAFTQAKDFGLYVTVHAGEAAGAQNVKDSILELGADRIGHGVRANEDKSVIDLLRQRSIPLEMCLTSNMQTGAVQPGQTHPLHNYLCAGLLVTINTDDPGVCATRLSDEYLRAINEFGLSSSEISQLLVNAIDSSFAPSIKKIHWRRDVISVLSSFGLY